MVIVADVDEYWLHGMIFALSENSATQELLHRKHPELRVLWHAGLVEIVAHVIVADVNEYWLHDHTRYLQPLRTEAVKWVLPPRIIRERSAAMGLDYFISPRVGFYFVLPDLNWTDLDASGGHCVARLRGSWEPLMARRQLLITFASKGYRLAVVQWIREGHCRRGIVGFFFVLLPGLTHLRSISSPARHWGDC